MGQHGLVRCSDCSWLVPAGQTCQHCGKILPPPGPPQRPETSELRAETKRLGVWLGKHPVLAGLAALIIIGGLAAAVLASSQGGSVTGSVVRYQAVDAGHLNVVVELRNSGGGSATAKCTVEATTPYGDAGWDYLDEPLAPHQTKYGTVGLIIQNNAAGLVDRVVVKDC